VNPANDGTSNTSIFAGAYGNIFISKNNGTNWTEVNDGLMRTGINTLVVDGGYIFAGTEGNGIWRRPLSEVITNVKNERNSIPLNFSLNQNYPNPFNPTTIISYSLPEEGRVRIKVFDGLGREVANLLDEVVGPGKHLVNWNGSNLSSGIFFYSISFKGQSLNKKMILMK
jgi:hypothetical protein